MSRFVSHLKTSAIAFLLVIALAPHLEAQTNFTVLARLSLATGMVPFGSMAVGPDGVLYGATAAGGVSNAGAVFRLNPDGSRFSTLISLFVTKGAAPEAGQIGRAACRERV